MNKINLISDDPLVSIIIPNYNYGRFISKSIQSVLDQTYKNIEIVIVDNCSNDNSLRVIKKFLSDKRIKLFELNKTYTPGTKEYAENVTGFAINEASGDFISVLYSDDWYMPKKIEMQLEKFKKLPLSYGVVHCHGYNYNNENNIIKKWNIRHSQGYIFKDLLLNNAANMIIPVAPLVKRHVYEIIGISNKWTGSEYDYFLMSQYVDFDYVDDYLVVMRNHEKNYRKDILSVYKKVKDFHEEIILRSEAIARGGILVNKKISRDYVSYGLTFILDMEMKYGKEAILKAIKIYPVHVFKPKIIIALLILALPRGLSRQVTLFYRKL